MKGSKKRTAHSVNWIASHFQGKYTRVRSREEQDPTWISNFLSSISDSSHSFVFSVFQRGDTCIKAGGLIPFVFNTHPSSSFSPLFVSIKKKKRDIIIHHLTVPHLLSLKLPLSSHQSPKFSFEKKKKNGRKNLS